MVVRRRPWTRGDLVVLGTAALVIASAIAVGALIRSFASHEDTLRKAEIGLAELNPLTSALLAHPENVVDRGLAAESDIVVNRDLRRRSIHAAHTVARNWPNATSRSLGAQTRANAELSGRVVGLVQAGRLPSARAVLARLAPRSRRLLAEVATARARLGDDIDGVQGTSSLATFAISGALGLALVGVMMAFSASRRRHAREETERRTLRDSEQRLQALVRHGSDVITVVAPDTTVIYEAGAVRTMLGYGPAELHGRRLSELLHPDDVPTLVSLCAAADGGGAARELRFRHRDGSYRTCEARATSLLGDELWNGIVLNVWDVSERKELEERLRHQAFHDALTGLANRALFGDRLEHALVRGIRGDETVSVLLIDLDDFKSINDSLGHAAGDELLQETARRISETMRAADTVARIGGDEFAVILDRSSSPADDERAARRITEAIAAPVRLGGRSFPVTASVGIARGRAGQTSADRLIRDADLAMYSAKGREKGSYATFRPDMHVSSEQRLQLKADLAHALAAGDQLVLHYQPVVSLRDREIVGLEALVRWNHPTRGLIAPEDFIPLAEETGAIVRIGRWVLREACRQGQAWDRPAGRELLISVNVSARQLQSADLVEEVRAALADSGLRPERLVLEVTETALMKDVELASRVLREIKRLGVQVAIDDFGTGYSSLSQLERLPVDILKVDREFARSGESRAQHAQLLRAVMEIGESLHLRTIAEGIETPSQLEEMEALDYPLGQGFLFSRPLPAEAVDELLAERRPSSPAADRAGATKDR